MKFNKFLLPLLSILFALMYSSISAVESTPNSLRGIGSRSDTEAIEVIPHAAVSSNTVLEEKNEGKSADVRAIAAVIMACVGGVGMIGMVATKMVNKRATSNIHRGRRY